MGILIVCQVLSICILILCLAHLLIDFRRGPYRCVFLVVKIIDHKLAVLLLLL